MPTTRDKLKSIARRTIQEKGVHGLNFRDLAAEANIKSSSVHYYFPKKSDLIYEVTEDYTRDFYAKMEKITQSSKGPVKQLEELFNLYKNNLPKRLCLCGMLAAESNQLDKRTKDLISQSFLHIQEWIKKRIESLPGKKAQAKGLAGLLFSSLQGALLMDGVKGREQYLAEVRKFFRTLV